MVLEITPCRHLFGVDSVAAFVLKVACGAELGTQHVPLEWCRAVASQGNICSEQGSAQTFHHTVAQLCAWWSRSELTV